MSYEGKCSCFLKFFFNLNGSIANGRVGIPRDIKLIYYNITAHAEESTMQFLKLFSFIMDALNKGYCPMFNDPSTPLG